MMICFLLEQDFSKSSLFVFKKRQITIMVGWFFGHLNCVKILFDQKIFIFLTKKQRNNFRTKREIFFLLKFFQKRTKLK